MIYQMPEEVILKKIEQVKNGTTIIVNSDVWNALIAALEFYAKEKNWRVPSEPGSYLVPIKLDFGSKARKALEQE